VDEVELVGALEHLRELEDMGRDRIAGVGVQAQRAVDRALQIADGLRVAAGEQCHLVPAPDQLIGERGNHPFGAAVERGRHPLIQRRNLGDPEHCRAEASFTSRPTLRDRKRDVVLSFF
jgi:hypothetical protein